MTIKDWLNQASNRLLASGINNYQQEAYWLLEELGHFSRTQFLLNPDSIIEENKLEELESALKKREERIPLQYLLHSVDFMKLKFHVNQNVLIPRPETEELVKWAHKTLKPNAKVLEIGTGSGCISIALKHYREDLEITAVDISEKALLSAEINVKEILGPGKINLISSDLFTNVKDHNFDAIISNPPYLSDNDMENIDPELSHEPRIALTCGGDGYDIYRRISSQSQFFLKNGGLIALEIGINQEKKIKEIFQQYLLIDEIKDYQGIVRDLVFKINL